MSKRTSSPPRSDSEAAPLTYAEQRNILLISEGFDLLHRGLAAGVWLGGFYFAAEAISKLAGLNTNASLIVHWMTSSEQNGKSVIVWGLLALLCAGWAVAERKLRQRKIARLAGRIAELESALDGARSSSGLTREGKTPPKVTHLRRRDK